MKPLYGVSEARNYWFATYHIYHPKKLNMTESTYDLYLFIMSKLLKIVKMQTNDTVIITNKNFSSIKKEMIQLRKIMI